jgi:hypothetical protein
VAHLQVGNCDVGAEQKILVTNEMKQFKIWSKLKVLNIKNICNLLPNFVKGLNKSWLEFCQI